MLSSRSERLDRDVPRTVADLRPGQRADVAGIRGDDLFRRRLLDLGVLPGTLVEALMTGPAGDPIAVRVRGTTLALRVSDARRIQIRSG